MKVRRLIFGVLVAILCSAGVGVLQADVKYLVNHKGDWICIDNSSVATHLNQHGDFTFFETC